MYPSFWSTSARATFCFEDGILTTSCIAVLALRTRVSMSAMGSVIMAALPPSSRRGQRPRTPSLSGSLAIARPARAHVARPSPTALRQAGDLAGMGQLAQAHPAEAELAEHRARPPAAPAAGVGADLELGLR